MIWIKYDPRYDLGFIPSFLDEANPKPARQQIHDNYQHGGGWHAQDGFKLTQKDTLLYPGDPPLRPVAETRLRDERILIYQHNYVAIIQPDRTFEVARID